MPESPLHIAIESPDQPEVRALIDALDAYQRALYPAESNHLVDISALLQPNVRFAVARDAQRRALGCGAVLLDAGAGELKRMFVDPAQRGRGVARRLHAFLESEAARAGATELRLETGIHQPEALALYEGLGYRRCGPFAGYVEDPLSVFMHKPLAACASA
ncbi:MAG TPA: GNAT family N-acetyltransferase [Albitalea sp.]|uniref:GNAT family N-acetyltransferase n=1 Tax=Piscinibacter sp. TaxID=1903157 RepID=UPI002ED2C791